MEEVAVGISTVVLASVYSWTFLLVAFVRPFRLPKGVDVIVLAPNEKIVLLVHLVCVWATEVMAVLWLLVSGDDHAFTHGFVVIWITVLAIGCKDAVDAVLASKSYRAAEHVWSSMTCIGTGALCMTLGSAYTDGFGGPAAFSMILGVFSCGVGREWYPRCRQKIEHARIGAGEEPIEMEIN